MILCIVAKLTIVNSFNCHTFLRNLRQRKTTLKKQRLLCGGSGREPIFDYFQPPPQIVLLLKT